MMRNKPMDANKTRLRWRTLLGCWLLLALLLPMAANADDVYVSNKPYKGRMYGLGDEIRFSIKDLAEALEVQTVQTPEGWFFQGVAVPTVEEQGTIWINLSDLPSNVVRVVRNQEFKSLDLYRSKGGKVVSQGDEWGADGTLVYFMASWSPACKAMKPTMSSLEQSRRIRVAYVDVEESSSAAFRDYAYLFEGDKVPLFVILDGAGRKLDSFFGFQTYSELLDRIERKLRSGP